LHVPGQPAQQPRQTKTYFVGDIGVIGNERTPDADILGVLDLYAGQQLPSKNELQYKEWKLWMKFRKRFDLRYTYHPSIRIRTYEDSEYVTVIIDFPEMLWERK
jgi:hypothetical protein